MPEQSAQHLDYSGEPVVPALCRPVQRQCELPHLVLEFDENQLHDHGADLNQRQFYRLYAFSRFRFKGRQNGLMLFLLLQMIRSFLR